MDPAASPLARKRKLPDADDDDDLDQPAQDAPHAPRRPSNASWSLTESDAALFCRTHQLPAAAAAAFVPDPPSPSSPKRPRTESGATIPLTARPPARKRTRSAPRATRRLVRHASAPAVVERTVTPPCPVPVDLSNPHIPCLQPLINRETLKELDLEQILRNPQLRHDLLFDSNLQFRPTSGRRKRDLVENYWRAVLQELENGCTCITLDYEQHLVDLKCACKRIPSASAQPLLVFSPADRVMTVRMPSRLRPLLIELLEVLLSVIQPLPTSSSGFYMQHPTTSLSGQQHQAEQHAAQAALLRSVLDPDLIEQELSHGLFDPSGLFRVIGDTLKCHCAPMRDRAVETMVTIAQTCMPGRGGTKADAIKALRMCFEVLEFMKLDIANHQLQTLRPFLVQSSAEFELKTFQERRVHGHFSLTTTRQWIEAAHQHLLAVPSPLPSFAASSPSLQLRLVALRAITDLTFVPPASMPSTPLPPPTTTPTCTSPPAISPLPGYPETLYLDRSRMAVLSADAADLTALYMLLMLYRQLVFSSSNTGPRAAVSEADLQRMKKEIWEIGPARLGHCFAAGRGRKEKSAEKEAKWRGGMRDAVLQIAARARGGAPPDEGTVRLVERWADANLRAGSALSGLLRDRLRNAVLEVVIESVLKPPGKQQKREGEGAARPAGAGMTGLEPLEAEIRHLGERLAKLATIHLNVYGPLYEQSGFMEAGAGC